MQYFERYSSNTLAGSGNQSYVLYDDAQAARTSRIFYRIFAGGEYHYSLLYSNIIDSTFADGAYSHMNLICDTWKIHHMRVALRDACSMEVCPDTDDFQDVTFSGAAEKTVMPGEFFATDPILLDAKAGQYLCVEMTFSGRMVPCHPESIIPGFLRDGDTWKPSRDMPYAGMVGCDRPVLKKIAYLGDSITQGIGTTSNGYAHWNALVSNLLGREYAYWNLGLGYGRAADAATDGAWLFKAKQADAVVVCYGVNDLLRYHHPARLQRDLNVLVETLRAAGKAVFLQTIPPFNYTPEDAGRWRQVNDYIRKELFPKVEGSFDLTHTLGWNDGKARYGGHPNDEGCKAWANALYPSMREFLAKL